MERPVPCIRLRIRRALELFATGSCRESSWVSAVVRWLAVGESRVGGLGTSSGDGGAV